MKTVLLCFNWEYDGIGRHRLSDAFRQDAEHRGSADYRAGQPTLAECGGSSPSIPTKMFLNFISSFF